MKKNREIVFLSLFFLFFVIIFLNFGIHVVRTVKFNNKERTLIARNKDNNCFFDIRFRGGSKDSWLKRNVQVNGKTCTLKGATFDGVFTNENNFEVSDWKLRINIEESCWLNNSWCGIVEIHQKDKSQTIDLRQIGKIVDKNHESHAIDASTGSRIELEYCYIDGEFMIPLEKGDFIIYHPSVETDEIPVHAFNGDPGTVTVGFIFYTDELQDFNGKDYSVQYNFHKGFFQGTEPLIFVILLTLWVIVLMIKIAVRIAYKKAENDAERRLNLQRMEDMKLYNAKLNADVESKTAHIKEIQQKVVIGLANVIGNRDFDTGGHVNRTSDIIKIIVDEFRRQNPGVIDDQKANDIFRAAPMHDLGKIYIDSSILCKPGKLTDEEYAMMKKHSENSGEIVKLILKDVEESHFVTTAFNVARHHHERWDGKGYPDKLSGTDIPLEARLMAIADVYDALVSRRCYKQPMSFDKAFEIMCEGMGTQFDPQMKSVFEASRQTLENYYTENNRK